MMVDNSLVKKIAGYILEDVDYEETVNELRRYKKSFPYEKDYNWYSYGNILPYYHQIRQFYLDSGYSCPEETEDMMSHFIPHVGKAVDFILAEDEKKKKLA